VPSAFPAVFHQTMPKHVKNCVFCLKTWSNPHFFVWDAAADDIY